jgi:hypothetical protein
MSCDVMPFTATATAGILHNIKRRVGLQKDAIAVTELLIRRKIFYLFLKKK